MDNKSDIGFFGIFGTIFTWVKWVAMLLFIIAIFYFGVELYPILKDCWTCNIFTTLYNTFSVIGAETFKYFQDNILVLISMCLALWIVYETYKALEPSLTFLYPDTPQFDDNFFKKIYKKIFLTTAVIGLVILNEPRHVFSNTYEITLDFGSGIGREFIRKKIIDKSKIPPECKEVSKELTYTGTGVLSDNTRNNMVCLLKEVNILRHDYMDLGISLVEHSKPFLITTFVEVIGAKIATFIGGRLISRLGGKKYLKGKSKKLEKLGEDAEKNKEKIEKIQKQIEKWNDDAKKGGIKRNKAKKIGKFVSSQSSNVALGVGIANFLAFQDVRMGISGLGLVIGLFIINMFFAFIIIEKMLFLGVSILLLPLLAGCYIFEQTRSFATKGLSDAFNFAIGLIFMCIAMVMCAEINDWILGGMFSAPNDVNISRTTQAIALIKSGKIDEFNKLVGTDWYFVYVIFVIGIDALLIQSAGTFASWFNGSISQSALVQPLWNLGKSTYRTVLSVTREIKTYVDDGSMSARDTGSFIDKFLKNRFRKKKDDKIE